VKRGDLYRVYKGAKSDPKKQRVFLVVSRQPVIDHNFSTVICAPVYSKYDGFTTQVEVGVNEGLKHDSAIYCDDLISLQKSKLTDYIGTLPDIKLEEVNTALRIALAATLLRIVILSALPIKPTNS
jgi:mRNA interferase MazF